MRTAFPYIAHACFASLFFKKHQLPSMKLGKAETKLLYTLNWLLLDAPSESLTNLDDNQNHRSNKMKLNEFKCKIEEFLVNNENCEEKHIYPISMIQLFIYLFIPILKSLNENDLYNLKLNNGINIWEPLWHHIQPNVSLFSNPINSKDAKHTILNIINRDKLIKDLKKTSSQNIQKSHSYIENINVKENVEDNSNSFSSMISEIDELRDELSNILIKTVGDDDITDGEILTKKAPLAHMSSICSFVDIPTQIEQPNLFSIKLSISTLNEHLIDFKENLKGKHVITTKTECEESKCLKNVVKSNSNKIATFFDVALIRCILNSKWHSEGYIWSLEYLCNRITQIASEVMIENEETNDKIKNSFLSLQNIKYNDFIDSKSQVHEIDKFKDLNNFYEIKPLQSNVDLKFVLNDKIR